MFSEKWLEKYGNSLPDDYCYDTELVSCGASGSYEGSYCRAQISVDDGKMASCWERPNEWRCEHMKLLMKDDKEEMSKTLPNKPDEG